MFRNCLNRVSKVSSPLSLSSGVCASPLSTTTTTLNNGSTAFPTSILSSCSSSHSLSSSAATTNVEHSTPLDPPFEKILIANRGEISCRVIRTCRKMGIKTVAVHSEADAHGLFVDMADESVCIGPPASAQSYLQIDRIVAAAKMTGAQAVHPGFGFLSENTNFAAALEANDVVFIGPRPHAIQLMGDKIQSKETALAAGVNCIPGDNRVIASADECVEVARSVGYPVMVKASAGGGGKGMRIAYNDRECRDAFRLATNEAKASFGDDRLFVEKFIEEPRHVEIQVLADTQGNVVYLNERDCSIQRRNQKVFEEAPSPASTPELRRKMGEQSCQLARAVDYISAGTCEFLVDKNLDFYFLEMNTRLQVEHPVTEFITGVDLVEQMINVAAGKALPFNQSDVGIDGWAIETRVYAENPFKDFLPQTGQLKEYKAPLLDDPAVRCDSGLREGAEISVHYDPMISKLITHGATREAALEKMREALDSYVIHGLNHNIPFLRTVCDHPRFMSGAVDTKFIEEEYPDGFDMKYITVSDSDIVHMLTSAATTYFKVRSDLDNDNNVLIVEKDGYGPSKGENYVFRVTVDAVGASEDEFKVNVINTASNESNEYSVENNFDKGDYVFRTQVQGNNAICQVISRNSHDITLQYKGLQHKFILRTPEEDDVYEFMPQPEVIDLERVLLAPMPGNIFSISVKVGQPVEEGQEVCVIEAMKMQNIFYAQKDGVVKGVYVKQGDSVQADQKIYELE